MVLQCEAKAGGCYSRWVGEEYEWCAMRVEERAREKEKAKSGLVLETRTRPDPDPLP